MDNSRDRARLLRAKNKASGRGEDPKKIIRPETGFPQEIPDNSPGVVIPGHSFVSLKVAKGTGQAIGNLLSKSFPEGVVILKVADEKNPCPPSFRDEIASRKHRNGEGFTHVRQFDAVLMLMKGPLAHWLEQMEHLKDSGIIQYSEVRLSDAGFPLSSRTPEDGDDNMMLFPDSSDPESE